MLEFFIEGGWGMWPVLVLGVLGVASAGRFAMDREPVRLRFVGVLGLALLVFIAQSVVTNLSKVLWVISDPERVPPELFTRVLTEGAKESFRPAVLGLGLLGLTLVFLAIGVYRSGRRELLATRGDAH